MSPSTPAEEREAIRALVARSGHLLDAGEYGAYVELYSADATYTLESDSPEIGRRMTWLHLDRDAMVQLLAEAPQHVHDLADRTHMITVDAIEFDEGLEHAAVRSTFAVFRTTQEGVSAVYAVGSYRDSMARYGSNWLISSRNVKVGTRMFASPTPVPL